MAETTLDLTPRKSRERSATFRRAQIPSDEIDDASTTARRAAYRPREEIARRRDVLESLRRKLERDATHTPDDRSVVADAVFAAALAEEALGRDDDAVDAIERLARIREPWLEVALVDYRIARRLGDAERAERALGTARERADGVASVLVGLENDYARWLDGCDGNSLELEAAPVESNDFTNFWRARLGADRLLAAGEVREAIESLRAALENTQDRALTVRLRERVAMWSAVVGDLEYASQLLVGDHEDELRPELREFGATLGFDLGRTEPAFRLLVPLAEHTDVGPSKAVTAAMVCDEADEDGRADAILQRVVDDHPEDWTALRLLETRLESRAGISDESLIDVFNRQLEGPLTRQERIAKLTRLGRLYEAEANLEEAAAEVYREALSLQPDHAPALRALGRLYGRRENWRGLAELYELEIEHMDGEESVWRRHFQLAEIYHDRLDRPQEALAHYQSVLDEKTHYLPALKASAAILGELGRWDDLADLFLASVDTAPTARQKLYLLDKVAEVAEEKLQNLDVAIGAWQEILNLEPEHPRAYASLGRLYAQAHRWHDLVELNLAEIELVEDDEEIAVLYQRSAEIAERHLGDLARAEAFYAKSLDHVPDFLPALEGLGRIYMQSGRWNDIVEMSGRELRQTDNPSEALRRLGALAELFETRLDRRESALETYERMLQLAPDNDHALESAVRLNYSLGRWDDIVALLEDKLARTDNRSLFAGLHGEIGLIREWKQDDFAEAYRRYLAAMDVQPENLHWLEGAARTWARAGADPTELAGTLEDVVVKPLPAQTRDAYFKVIGRLRERAEASPDASRAFRAHGDQDDVENRLVLEMAMAVADERDALRDFRRAHPEHVLERLIDVERTSPTEGDHEALTEAVGLLGPVEKSTYLQFMDGALASRFVGGQADPWLVLGADMHRVMRGESVGVDELDAQTLPLGHRLRAVEAELAGDFAELERRTRQELEKVDSRDLETSRLIELATLAGEHAPERVEGLLAEAAEAAFPEMNDEGAVIETCDGPNLDRLYEALRDAECWELERRCLEAHAARDGVSEGRRLHLFDSLAELLEERIGEVTAAANAVSHCWQLSENPDYLRKLVRLHQTCDDLETAIRFQQRHFEQVSEAEEADEEAVVRSGIWLAELLLEDPERVEDGIDCLEHLLATHEVDERLLCKARRELAYAYVDRGNAYRAVELFQEFLGAQVSDGERADWRKLVRIYRDELDDMDTAYGLQWKLVEYDPGCTEDLDALVNIAAFGGFPQDCVDDLQGLAANVDDDLERVLLAQAAQLTEEELFRVEEAEELYEKAIELSDDSGDALELRRRRAFCLSQIAGRERQALDAFRSLIADEPFEPTTYRGLRDLLERSQAHDRARVAGQLLEALDCDVELETIRGKRDPSRPLSVEQIDDMLLPESLQNGILDVLQAAMPLVEKVFADELPQKKALEGVRLKKLDDERVQDAMSGSMLGMDIGRFKAECGDTGPASPQVFAGGTPYVWLNWDAISELDAQALRFVTGYAAAVAWSEVGALEHLDGRKVWHLVEAIFLKQTGEGFTDRVDVRTQELVEEVSSPFYAVARRRVASALEGVVEDFADADCERWATALRTFACRVGLAMSGNVRAAIEGLLRFEGWGLPIDMPETQRQLRRRAETRELMAFAMSEDYLQTRYALGLSGRPSQLPE
jgi:tetratricopeptide (TPR) repeat protein